MVTIPTDMSAPPFPVPFALESTGAMTKEKTGWDPVVLRAPTPSLEIIFASKGSFESVQLKRAAYPWFPSLARAKDTLPN